ncbi:hypothetical protein COM75_25050 [Bacillus toyonensis]|nr:hypothetical protein COM75_25050 [Bacillus toyonensis]
MGCNKSLKVVSISSKDKLSKKLAINNIPTNKKALNGMSTSFSANLYLIDIFSLYISKYHLCSI